MELLGRQEVWSITYDPYGNTSTPISSISQNVRLLGQYYDTETTFNYNIHRDYFAGWGRYLEADPIGLAGGMNPYLYANANPGKFVDPSGLLPQWFQSKLSPQDLQNMQANMNQATNNAFTPAEVQQLTQFVLNDMTMTQAADFVNIWTLKSTFNAQNMTQSQFQDINNILNDIQGPLGDKARAAFKKALASGICKVQGAK